MDGGGFDGYDESAFNFYFESLIESINNSKDLNEYYFHKSDVIKPLKELSEIDCYDLLEYIELAQSNKSILFLGDPGTGKTHGVSAFSEKLLSANLHLPLLIQAKDISEEKTWKDIIQEGLSVGSDWSEEELWQGLTSLVSRHRFYKDSLDDEVKITPKLLVIIDGLDEFSTSEKWLERIKQANVISKKYPQIRFCFTARPIVFKFPIDWAVVKRVGSNGDVPVYKLFDAYVKKYNISAQNMGWLRYALSTPLALKLFCEINRNNVVDYSKYSDIAIPNLWRSKIDIIENEFCLNENILAQNQYVLRAIVLLAELYIENSRIERKELITYLTENLSIAQIHAEKLIRCFEVYGIVNCYYEKGLGILPDKYFYYPGIQGYFDYAIAEILIDKFKHPKEIEFGKCKGINHNALYGLAILSIQRYGYLLTDNKSIFEVIGEYEAGELQFYALQHTDSENAVPYIQRIQNFMSENASKLITIVNKLVLPFSRYEGHPLGITLLDDFLSSFEKPAQRDIIWSIHGYLRDAYGSKWYQGVELELEKEEYVLTSDDKYNGCPVAYAWALSTINNSKRKVYRDRLMEWASLVPNEFFKLFLKFSQNNDPQICSDLYSILVCVIYECSDKELIETVSKWICSNVLHPDKIGSNRDISIRYYSIAIIRKAVSIGIFTQKEANPFLPPYTSTTYNIKLNKEALSGTRMSGYSGIDYDLARYVLIDHFEYAFEDYSDKEGGKFFELIKKVATEQPEYIGITTEQFILSATYAYILQIGWNKNEFRTHKKNGSENAFIGVDSSILATYFPATHGEKSSVMTVCEKYVWQARNYISGFLCDRLPFGEENSAITDYGLLDDFIISTQEIRQIDPDNIPLDNPWHIPENDKVILESTHNCKEDIISNIKNAPIIDWEKWLFTENNTRKFKPECKQLLGLCMLSNFFGSAGVETSLFVNSILISKADVPLFLSFYSNNDQLSSHVYNPSDWYGGNESSCYITPKEICWFPWKSHYNSYNIEEFPGVSISSATDKCVYNFPDFGDVYYYMPSPEIRDALDICDTDGYIYYDIDKNIKAEYCIAGEKWKNYQHYLWVDKDRLLSYLDKSNQTIIWILKEIRQQSGKSKEKYGEFYGERVKVSIGYFDDDKFITKEMLVKMYPSKPPPSTKINLLRQN